MHHPPENLQTRYAASLAQKHVELSRVWAALQAQPDDVALGEELNSRLHRLSGSAGSYGYLRLGEAAQRLDERMRDWRETAPASRSSTPELVESLRIDIAVLLDELMHPQLLES
jgi:HPt (histidine-containing phosphotransfer) domain-containing protein